MRRNRNGELCAKTNHAGTCGHLRPSMNVPEDILSALFFKWPIARLATVSEHGQPHAVPVVFCEHDGLIYSPMDGKRKSSARLKRFANLAGNPNASLLLDAYDADWQSLWWVRIDGKADWIEPSAGAAKTIANRLVAKYPQYHDPALMFDTNSYLRLQPAKITAWAQSNTSTTINAAISKL